MEHKDTKTQSNISAEEYARLQSLSNAIIGAAIEVHRELGPGLLESVYEECLRYELETKGLNVKTQVDLPLLYKGNNTGKQFRIDMLVELRTGKKLCVLVSLCSVKNNDYEKRF